MAYGVIITRLNCDHFCFYRLSTGVIPFCLKRGDGRRLREENDRCRTEMSALDTEAVKATLAYNSERAKTHELNGMLTRDSAMV